MAFFLFYRYRIKQPNGSKQTPSSSPLSGGERLSQPSSYNKERHYLPLSAIERCYPPLSAIERRYPPLSAIERHYLPLSAIERSYPPDKGGKGGFVPYDTTLTEKARNNRKNPTPAEKKLWHEALQAKQLVELKFTRQKPLKDYIVDFYCAKLMLAIEIDGDTHAEREEYDKQRTTRLNQQGIEVIRYTNQDVLNNIEGVYMDLLEKINSIRQRPKPPKSPLSGGL